MQNITRLKNSIAMLNQDKSDLKTSFKSAYENKAEEAEKLQLELSGERHSRQRLQEELKATQQQVTSDING